VRTLRRPPLRRAHSNTLGAVEPNSPTTRWCGLTEAQGTTTAFLALAGGFPDNDANTEPADWLTQAESWGFADRLAGQTTARTVPLAGIAEMADRVRADNWAPNLAAVLGP
jgi:hypothetical protein